MHSALQSHRLYDPRQGNPSAIPLNPYIAGKSLTGDCGFFGRKDIFELVQKELARNAIVLFGQRRIGKTSILKQLQRRLRKPFLPVYFDLMDRAEQPMGQLLTGLAQQMAQGAGLPQLPAALDNEGVQFRQQFLPELYRTLGTEHAMVLLLDEFDVLDRSAEQQLPPTAAARAFFPYLRQLIETERRLHFLVVIGRKTEELSSDFKATFKAAKFKRVSVLSTEDAHQLATLAEQQQSLRFAPGVVEGLLQLTTGHPYLTQLLCQQLWDAAHVGSSEAAPLVTHPLLEKVIPQALEAGQNVFEWIWDGLPPAERVMLAAIAEAIECQPAVSEEQVVELLQRHGVRVLSGDLDLAPRKLVDWELLREVPGGYRCHIELIRRWVLSQKPLPRVKNEVYRLNPLAERLFLSARDFYALDQPVKTQDHLLDVLQLNPGHLPARLLLAKLLQEKGRHAHAVQELEKAWEYDQAAARMPLVGALLTAGESYERRGELHAALASYERVLTLSPDDRTAVERLIRLRQEQAVGAAAAGEGKPVLDQLRLLCALIGQPRPKHLDLARGVALNSEAQEDWDTALQAYRWLEEKSPGSDRWAEDITRVLTQKDLAHHYRLAAEAAAQKTWNQAVAALSHIVAVAPAYRNAARQLSYAVEQLYLVSTVEPTRGGPAALAAAWQRARLHRRRRLSLGGALLLGAALASGLYYWIEESNAVELLSEIDSALADRRWQDAQVSSTRIIGSSWVSAKTRQRAVQQREQAEREAKVQPVYERLANARGNYDEALALYHRIPVESAYYDDAKWADKKALPLFVEHHLATAEGARALNRCDTVQRELRMILDEDRLQPKALQALERPCGDRSALRD